MKILKVTSSIIGTQYWLELADGRVMKYDLLKLKLNEDYIKQNAFSINREIIGLDQSNPDYAEIKYSQPPPIRSTSWEKECILAAKEDVLIRNLVLPEFMSAFLEVL